jgi:hypothetical protein
MTRFTITSALIAVVLAAACTRREERPHEPAFRPTATVKDIMTSIVDPESDVIWNSVATIVSLTGTEERAPQTDEEWAAVRRSAVQLVEATNLLRIPGRLVAKPGEKSENPRIELQPETIQRMIAEDPPDGARSSTRSMRPRYRRSRPSMPRTRRVCSTQASTWSTPVNRATSSIGIRRRKPLPGDTSQAAA